MNSAWIFIVQAACGASKMQWSILISSLALVVAAASLFVSIRNNSFNRRAKLNEIRYGLVDKMFRVHLLIESIVPQSEKLTEIATSTDDPFASDLLREAPDIHSLLENASRSYKYFLESSIDSAMELQEEFGHDVERLLTIATRSDAILAKLLNHYKARSEMQGEPSLAKPSPGGASPGRPFPD